MKYLYTHTHTLKGLLEVTLSMWGKRNFDEVGKACLRIVGYFQADLVLSSIKYVRQIT